MKTFIVLAVLVSLTGPAWAGQYDGQYEFSMSSSSPEASCQVLPVGIVTIQDSQISGKVSNGQFTMDGMVSGDRVTGRAVGPQVVDFTGKITGRDGSGSWDSGWCDGRWELERQ